MPSPSRITCIGSLGEAITTFALEGHYLYAAGGHTLHIMDVIDGAHPRTIGRIRMDTGIDSLAVKDAVAFIGTSQYLGLFIIDLAAPSAPAVLQAGDAGNSSCNLERMGQYLARYDSGHGDEPLCRLYDIRNPRIPRTIFSEFTRHARFATNGERLFYLSHGGKREASPAIIEYNNPAFLPIAPPFRDPFWANQFYAHPREGTLVVGDPDDPTTHNVPVADVRSWQHFWDTQGETIRLHPVGRGPFALCGGKALPWEFSAAGVPLPATSTSLKLSLLNRVPLTTTSARLDPFPLLKTLAAPSATTATQLCNALTLVRDKMLWLYNIEGGLDWRRMPDFAEPGVGFITRRQGNIVFLFGEHRVSAIDCANPTHPRLISSLAIPFTADYAEIAPPRAYVATSHGDLLSLDIAHPSTMSILAHTTHSFQIQSLAMLGARLAIATKCSGLQILDPQPPRSPVLIGQYTTSATSLAVAVRNSQAFLFTSQGLSILDCSAPAHPTLIVQLPLAINQDEIETGAYEIRLLGPAAYLIAYESTGVGSQARLRTVNIANPRAPHWVGAPLVAEAEDTWDAGARQKSEAKNQPLRRRASPHSGWLLALPTEFHISTRTYRSLVFYDLADPLHPRRICRYRAVHYNSTAAIGRGLVDYPDADGGLLLLGPARPAVPTAH